MKKLALILGLVVLVTMSQLTQGSQEQTNIRNQCLKQAKKYLEENSEIVATSVEKAQYIMNRMIVVIVESCEAALLLSDQPNTLPDQGVQKRGSVINQLIQILKDLESSKDQELSQFQRQIIEDYYKLQDQEAIHLFGYNLKKLPKSAKVYYFIAYFLIVSCVLYSGLKDINAFSNPSTKKEA